MTKKISLGPVNNPGGAFWCTEHPIKGVDSGGRLECVKLKKRTRERCHGNAVRGTDSCTIHGGHRLATLKEKGSARITAWSALGEPASGQGVNSGMAVMGMLQMTWLRAAAYGELLRQQVVKEGAVPEGEDYDPERIVEAGGLIGYRFGAAGKDGNIFRVSEDVRALVILEAAERDRVVKFAKTAHDMGISERLTGLAERWGDLVVTRIMLVLDALDLTADQEAMVPALIQAHLGQIEINAMGAGGDKT